MSAIRIRPEPPADDMTLGWAVYAWMSDYLVHGITGEQLDLNDETLEFLLSFYALDEEGEWLYDRAAMRRARGTGKSPTVGNIADAELCCEHVRFGGWDLTDDYGNLGGLPAKAPQIQIVATTLEQTKPIFDISAAAFTDRAIERYQLDIGIEAIVKKAWPPGRIQRVPNNPRGLRGPRPTLTIAEEVSEWVIANSGHAAMVRIRSNLAKDPSGTARLLEIGNAFVPGEDSHAERTYQAYTAQVETLGESRILYDSLEADPALRLNVPEELEEAIRQAAGDSDLNIRTLVNTALDQSVTVSQFRREHLNQILSDEDSLISAQLFDELSQDVPELGPEDVCTIGFDGALTGDGTAIVAFRLSDRSFHLLHYWEPDPHEENWRIDETAVDEAFRAELTRRPVWASGCDVHPFESWVYAWERDFGHKMRVKMSSAGNLIRDNRTDLRNLTFSCEALVNEIESKNIRFRSTYRMREHWGNAKRRLNTYGYSFGKITRSSKKRVDIVAASLMAYMAATALAKSPLPDRVIPGQVVPLKP